MSFIRPSLPSAQSVIQTTPQEKPATQAIKANTETTVAETTVSKNDLAHAMLEKGSATPTVAFTELRGISLNNDATLGEPVGKPFSSETQALKKARLQNNLRSPFLKRDLAVVKQGNSFRLFKISNPTGIFSTEKQYDSYAQLRKANLQQSMPVQSTLTAVITSKNDIRYLTPQAGPTYARPVDPPRLSAPSMPATERKQKVADLRQNMAQVMDRLKNMQKDLGQAKDHRGVFSGMYTVITERGIQELDALTQQGKLREAEFLGSLCLNFANHYFDAYDAYTEGPIEDVPEAWRNAFDLGRQAETTGFLNASVTEIASLSMVAHIINDLPQTLQEIGYPEAADKNETLLEVYNFFDSALMDEKADIVGALDTYYGANDMGIIDGVARQNTFGLSDMVQRKAFTGMRRIARKRSENLSVSAIESQAIRLSDYTRMGVPSTR